MKVGELIYKLMQYDLELEVIMVDDYDETYSHVDKVEVSGEGEGKVVRLS